MTNHALEQSDAERLFGWSGGGASLECRGSGGRSPPGCTPGCTGGAGGACRGAQPPRMQGMQGGCSLAPCLDGTIWGAGLEARENFQGFRDPQKSYVRPAEIATVFRFSGCQLGAKSAPHRWYSHERDSFGKSLQAVWRYRLSLAHMYAKGGTDGLWGASLEISWRLVLEDCETVHMVSSCRLSSI